MFKPISVNLDSVRQSAQPMPTNAVNYVFKVLHGYYGNLFLSKFSTGDLNDAGADKGVTGAKQVWAYHLKEFDADTVKLALLQCQTDHLQYPPSLPQFAALCRANKPRDAYQAPQAAIGMSHELRSQYTKKARAAATARLAQIMKIKTGYVELTPDLDGLKLSIANAVAFSGGDEVAELRRLDAMFATKGKK